MEIIRNAFVNCKVKLSLTRGEKCLLSPGENIEDRVGNVENAETVATFKTTNAKLYVPAVTLLTKNNVKLSKQLNDGFKRSVYWNKYKTIPNKQKKIS